ncbi:Crp/Fnr family transcriptional regulator [Bradyrhizobium sp. Pear77]|uniref:Crp/Fnr family transcriptional regulator n=1 Tax=Bradyrhizobium TaxID=374 RepID=UPI001E5FE769|nr:MULTISPECIES: Crp/Fnr family transcriptional regulator [Bradyrhizobium]MCC8954359.1 Crp/Fnr family transcriptional regulator [Bradyrhizobium altum]MCC8964381.1 Crp/Fnr family transcriptional regulator [Bradyrhizobium oropedii]
MPRTRSNACAKASRSKVSETLRVPRSMLERLVEIAPNLSLRKIAKGQSVYRQGDAGTHAYVVVSGRLGITMIGQAGQELLIDIVGPGALCGEGAAFDGLPRFSSASAIEATDVLPIAGKELLKLISADAKLASLLAHATALKQRTLAGRLVQLAQASPEDRIAELLSQIALPELPDVLLTHQQIANLIGASRITVTRAMQKLRKVGTVSCQRGRYRLTQPPTRSRH